MAATPKRSNGNRKRPASAPRSNSVERGQRAPSPRRSATRRPADSSTKGAPPSRGKTRAAGSPPTASREAAIARPTTEGPGTRGPETRGSATRAKLPKAALGPQELLGLYRPDLAQELADSDSPPYRYRQVYEHLAHHPGSAFADATALPGDLRSRLETRGASVLRETARRSSEDGTTTLLLAAPDGACIETVVMRYRQRVTACISTQVGCAVGCVFCATGGMGLRRNLDAPEIVDQVRAASALLRDEGRTLSNVVYMGMGEPLLNLQAVLTSIRILTDPAGMDMAHRSISVSTVGIPAGIRRLAEEEPQVNLAISLHAADDRLRARLIPPRFRHSLAEILNAAWGHFELTHRKLLVEYVLLGGINDSPEDARRLAALLKGHVVAVNLLVWNRVRASSPAKPSAGETRPAAASADRTRSDDAPGALRAPTPQAIAAFRSVLTSARLEAVVRQSRGGRIDAACGQLAGRRGAYSD